MDDQPKYMLLGYKFDSQTQVLSLQLKQTQWRYCQFVWNHRFDGQENAERKRNEWQNRLVYEHLSGREDKICYPNSFCLHLVIETADGNVLVSDISKKKTNDYPETKAFTIGKQIERSDFAGPGDCVTTWVRRAIFEEFGLYDAAFDEQFDASTIRVLSLDLEEDIFNFALVCTVKMRHKLSQFKKAAKLDRKELSAIFEMPLDETRSVLLGYPENQDSYHPSSYMRLLSFYLYKKGLVVARGDLENRI